MSNGARQRLIGLAANLLIAATVSAAAQADQPGDLQGGPDRIAAGAAPASQADLHSANAAAWMQPFRIELPPPARNLLLQPGLDPDVWARGSGLQSYQVVTRSRHGAIIETRLNEPQWQELQARVCSSDALLACETASCRSIQLNGAVSPADAGERERIKARLVHNPPESLPQAGSEATTCQGPQLLPPLSETQASSAAGRPLDILLDLRNPTATANQAASGPSADAASSADARSAQDIPSQSAAPAPSSASASASASRAGPSGMAGNRSGFRFSVASSLDPRGAIELDATALPADSSAWSLVVGEQCNEVRIPLDSLEPAHEPGQITTVVQPGAAAAIAATFNLTVLRDLTLERTAESLVVFASADDIATVIAALERDPRVRSAQPEFIYRTTADAGAAAPAAVEPVAGPSDPFAALSYGPQLTGALELQAAASGTGQRVAVIDTGIDLDHPELAGRVSAHQDLSGYGWSADVHGTAVAGIIAANANNDEGSYGIAPSAELLALKACQPLESGGLSARCRTSALVKALDVAMAEDAAVINMSLAGPPDALLARYVDLALQEGRLIVAGAGNGGPHARPGFPAALPGVLAVTAVDAAGRHYARANLGDYIDLAAPGVDIVVATPNRQYPPLSGTSMAAAHVAGIAALLRELVPLMSGPELRGLLRSQARDLGPPGTDTDFGMGLVDACASAASATAQAVLCAGASASRGEPGLPPASASQGE
ncbi:MAG: S8 family serine peptidase [Pseudomonadales bacterium]